MEDYKFFTLLKSMEFSTILPSEQWQLFTDLWLHDNDDNDNDDDDELHSCQRRWHKRVTSPLRYSPQRCSGKSVATAQQ